MSERGQTGGRSRARNDAESNGDALPRRDPGGAGRSRGRIPTRFSRENPPLPATDEPPRRRTALTRRGGTRPALEPTPYTIRPGAPALPAQPAASESGTPAPAAAFSVRPGGPESPAEQPPDSEGAIVGVLVEDRPEQQPQQQPAPAADAGPATARPRRQPAGDAPPSEPEAERRGAGTAKARSRRRRRLLRTVIVGGVLVAGGAVLAATALGRAGSTNRAGAGAAAPSTGASLPAAQPPTGPQLSASASAAAQDPLSYLATAATDTAPLSVQTLFPGRTITVNGHGYTRVLTDATPDCASAAAPPLDAVLRRNGCRAVFRATYTAGGTAVTVGIAVFDTSAQAGAVKAQATSGNLESLFGGKTPKFCRAVACRLTTDTAGRYAYFTVAGYTSGKPVPANDTTALAAGDDTATAAFQVLAARARAAAARAGTTG